MNLYAYRVLSFDCYGTLIDWESGIHDALRPLLARAGQQLPRDAVLSSFARHEAAQQAQTPALPYRQVLACVHRHLAAEWGVAADAGEDARFGASVGAWPPFPDSVAALRYLGQHHALAILSNIDRASFAESARHLEVAFDLVVTAQDVGSYKPNPANFRALLDGLAAMGVTPGEVLHTAQSLFHDHAPAQAMGLATAWIDRRHDQPGFGATMPPPANTRFDYRFTSLGEMVAAHRTPSPDALHEPI